jgi:hypothetical protein
LVKIARIKQDIRFAFSVFYIGSAKAFGIALQARGRFSKREYAALQLFSAPWQLRSENRANAKSTTDKKIRKRQKYFNYQ